LRGSTALDVYLTEEGAGRDVKLTAALGKHGTRAPFSDVFAHWTEQEVLSLTVLVSTFVFMHMRTRNLTRVGVGTLAPQG
jgi:hypothetical protein